MKYPLQAMLESKSSIDRQIVLKGRSLTEEELKEMMKNHELEQDALKERLAEQKLTQFASLRQRVYNHKQNKSF